MIKKNFAGLLMFLSGMQFAQAEAPTVEQFVQTLVGPKTKSAQACVRGTRLDPTDINLASDARVRLSIQFEKNSSNILPSRALESLISAVGHERLSCHDFLFVGHTDSTGSEAYNQDLSERRAASLRAYLIENHSVPVSQIETIGFGEQVLFNRDLPEAAENRRVEVLLLTPAS
jgi:outer membrane protein OmpA-like peptidoglycan-associated protein